MPLKEQKGRKKQKTLNEVALAPHGVLLIEYNHNIKTAGGPFLLWANDVSCDQWRSWMFTVVAQVAHFSQITYMSEILTLD